MAEPAPHFIGWLPMPRAFSQFLLPVAIGAVVGVVAVAGWVAWGQRSPGATRWDDRTSTFEGVVYAEPYAMIRVPADDGSAATVLLVEEGKHGATERVKAFDGRPVRVSGTLLHRDGRRMLELASGDAGLDTVEMAEERVTKLRRTPPVPLGRVTLVGEIVDAKCYLGAMKPGEGRTHRGCAILCLRGGVPPLFVTRAGGEPPTYHLLVNSDGSPLSSAHFDRVGERISLSADLERWDDLAVLKLAPGDR